MSGQDMEDGDVTHETGIPKLCFAEHGFLEMLVGTLKGKQSLPDQVLHLTFLSLCFLRQMSILEILKSFLNILKHVIPSLELVTSQKTGGSQNPCLRNVAPS